MSKSSKRLVIVAAMFMTALRLNCLSGARSEAQNGASAPDTQGRSVWTDPSTGLMWTGKDVSWKKAMKYCRDLRLAGYSDWRLANIGELQGIYDKNLDPSGMIGKEKGWAFPDRVKGNLYLTGNQ